MVIVIEDEMRGRKDEVSVARWVGQDSFEFSGFRFRDLGSPGLGFQSSCHRHQFFAFRASGFRVSVSGFRFKGLECVGARTWWRSRGRFQTFEGFRV
jgi:hypothetical protein